MLMRIIERRTGAFLLLLAAAGACHRPQKTDSALPSGDRGGPPLTREELIRKADEICRLGQERFAKIQAQPPRNLSEANAQTEQIVQSTESEMEGLRGLVPPDERRAAYAVYLAAREDALKALHDG